MIPRVLPLLLLLILAGSARADLQIKKAFYGNSSSYRDVSAIVTAYLRHNTLSFPVNARSMGVDPTPRSGDFLVIDYRAGRQEFTDTVAEGKVFTFQGVANVERARSMWNLPFLPPATPQAAPLLVVNRTSENIHLYSVDRFGRWVWVGDMLKGQTLAMSACVGQEWIATDRGGRVLIRERVANKGNTLSVDELDVNAPRNSFRGEETRVYFENAHYRPRYLYNLDPQGRWSWMATLEPSGTYTAATAIGETWIATDTANHVVRQITITPALGKVKLH